ncbi:MAG: methionyl-tRNA formyltransferase, partial [Marinoscillum sp.]
CADLVVRTLEALNSGNYELTPQIPSSEEKHAPKIFREDCEINWNQPSERVRNFIRGLSPYPAAWTTLDGQTFKVYFAEKSEKTYTEAPGTFKTDGKTYLDVITSDGVLSLTEVQLQGKKRMSTGDFLRGYQLGV